MYIGNNLLNLQIYCHYNISTKLKHLGCKKGVGPIRSSPTYVRPKVLISAEAKKSPTHQRCFKLHTIVDSIFSQV